MKKFCITPNAVKTIRDAIESKQLDLDRLYNLPSAQRKQEFMKYLPEELAEQVNISYENMKSKKQISALKEWADRKFPKQMKEKPVYKSLIDKINNLKNIGVLDDNSISYYESLIKDTLDLNITQEEAKTIRDLTDQLNEQQAILAQTKASPGKPSISLGTPNVKYWEIKERLENYINSRTVTPLGEVLADKYSRASMLSGIPSSVLNLFGGAYLSFEEALKRSAEFGTQNYMSKYANDYFDHAHEVFIKSGYNLNRIQTLSDAFTVLGESVPRTGAVDVKNYEEWIAAKDKIYAQAGGGVKGALAVANAAARLGIKIFADDFVFKFQQGYADFLFASVAFNHSLSSRAFIHAGLEGLSGEAQKNRADELFLEGINPEAQGIAKTLREQALQDSAVATATNDGVLANTLIGFRELINKAGQNISDAVIDNILQFVPPSVRENVKQFIVFTTGLGRVSGNILFAFVKTMSNLSERGFKTALENTGIGLIGLTRDIYSVINSNGIDQKKALSKLAQNSIVGGIGFAFPLALALALDDDDFIPAFETLSPKQALAVKSRNLGTNYIILNGVGISLDFIAPLAIPFSAMMFAKREFNSESFQKKYKQKYDSAAEQALASTELIARIYAAYTAGALSQLYSVPGVKQIADYAATVKTLTQASDSALETFQTAVSVKIINQFNKAIPALIGNFAKATDNFKREADRGTLDKLIEKIPKLRETLPISRNVITGEPLKTDGVLDFIYGERINVEFNSPLLNQVISLIEEDRKNSPAIMEVRRIPVFKEYGKKYGREKLTEASNYYLDIWAKEAKKLVTYKFFTTLTPKEKTDRLNDIRRDAIKKTKRKFNIKEEADES